MLWEYMNLTVLPFLRPGVLTFFGGGRGCAGALTRSSTRHLLPNEGWAYLRILLYVVASMRVACTILACMMEAYMIVAWILVACYHSSHDVDSV